MLRVNIPIYKKSNMERKEGSDQRKTVTTQGIHCIRKLRV